MPRFHYVYILERLQYPERPHVGMTTDLQRQLAEHNSGKSKHTAT
jgi:predicted GIY-YIG superfamily endonuclease